MKRKMIDIKIAFFDRFKTVKGEVLEDGKYTKGFLCITPMFISDEKGWHRTLKTITHVQTGLNIGCGYASRKKILKLYEIIKDLKIDWESVRTIMESKDYQKLRVAIRKFKQLLSTYR